MGPGPGLAQFSVQPPQVPLIAPSGSGPPDLAKTEATYTENAKPPPQAPLIIFDDIVAAEAGLHILMPL